jgi:hypothetical protein
MFSQRSVTDRSALIGASILFEWNSEDEDSFDLNIRIALRSEAARALFWATTNVQT